VDNKGGTRIARATLFVWSCGFLARYIILMVGRDLAKQGDVQLRTAKDDKFGNPILVMPVLAKT
jgi:hypothetical protein